VALAPPRDTLHLEADLVSNVEINQIQLIENGSGGLRAIPDTSYTLTPTFPDTAASGLGGRRYHLSFTTPLRPGILRYTLHTRDRYGLTSDFNVVFQFFTQLRAGGNPLIDNDPVGPAADLTLKLVLPTPITDPQTQLGLAVDSLTQAFTATALDTTGRDWLLAWTHAPYASGTHRVELTALDSLHRVHHFRVVDGMSAENRLLRDVLAFPNPFDDQIGSAFSFYLLADGATDVMLRLFTVSGKAIYQRVEHGLSPGYHQWPWDGRDMEGDKLANGVYLYKMVATSAGRSDTFDGRLVKLRKPRRSDVTTPLRRRPPVMRGGGVGPHAARPPARAGSPGRSGGAALRAEPFAPRGLRAQDARFGPVGSAAGPGHAGFDRRLGQRPAVHIDPAGAAARRRARHRHRRGPAPVRRRAQGLPLGPGPRGAGPGGARGRAAAGLDHRARPAAAARGRLGRGAARGGVRAGPDRPRVGTPGAGGQAQRR
jgi:hypothetical protein